MTKRFPFLRQWKSCSSPTLIRRRFRNDQKSVENSLKRPSIPELPLSPLIDPRLIEARTRYRKPKPLPSKPSSEFEKKLSNSPYAQALATPIRNCSFTKSRLPSYFLLHFGVAKHPKTGDQWHLPLRIIGPRAKPNKDILSNDKSVISEEKEQAKEAGTAAPDEKSESTNKSSQEPEPAKSKPNRPASSGTWYHSSHLILNQVSLLPRRKYLVTVSNRWAAGRAFPKAKLVWREDMADFALERLREQTCSMLEYCAGRPAAYVVGCRDVTQAMQSSQVGAAVWLGDDDKGGEEGEQPHPTNNPPPFYAFITYHQHYTPYYNLRTLLGAAGVRRLRAAHAHFRRPVAVLKHKRNTVPALMMLWKLMGYAAPARDAVGGWVAEEEEEESARGSVDVEEGGEEVGGRGEERM